VLNILSDNALIAGFGYHKKPVTPAIVRETIADYRGHGRLRRQRWALFPLALALLFAGLILTPAGKNLIAGLEPLVRYFGFRISIM